MLDFARTFPTEARLADDPLEKGAMLYKLLRPELVKANPVPLNPDSFTRTPPPPLPPSPSFSFPLRLTHSYPIVWTSKDPHRLDHAKDVRAATLRLRTAVRVPYPN